MTNVYPPKHPKIGDTILEVKNLAREGVFEDVSFTLRAGEILGMSGLVGAGRTEVARAVFGLDKLQSGGDLAEGEKVQIRRVPDAIRRGSSTCRRTGRAKAWCCAARSGEYRAGEPEAFQPGILLNRKQEDREAAQMSKS